MPRSTAPRFGDGVAYASKAFLCIAMARLVAEEGLDLDVATGGELHVALHAGFPAERIVFHGNNKSTAELRAALDAGVGRIVVDSFDELDAARSARRRRRCAAPRVHGARDARRRGAHARVHRDRHRGLEVRLRARRTATRSRAVRAGRRAAAAALRRPALPHRFAGVPARLVRGRGRPDGRARARRSRRETGVDRRRAEPRRRPRRALPRRATKPPSIAQYAAVAARVGREGARRRTACGRARR